VGHTDLWMRPGKALLGASLVGDPGEYRTSIGVSGLVQQPWLRLVVRMAGLAVTLWAVLSTLPSGSGRLEPLCTLTVDVLAWLVWAATDGRGRLLAPTLAAMGIAGGITAMSDPSALVFVGVAAGGAAVVWNLPTATVLAAGAPAGFVVAAAVGGSLPGRMLAVGTVSLVGLLAGVASRQIVHQATQATELASAIDQAALARRIGARLLRTIPEVSGETPPVADIPKYLASVLPVLAQHDVKLGLENGKIPAEELKWALDQVDSPLMGVVLDTVNSLAVPEGWKHVAQVLAPYTICLHLKDFVVQRVWHMMGFTVEGRPAGKGQVDIPWLLETLKAARSDFNVIIELWPPEQGTLEETIALEEAWAVESVLHLRRYIRE